MFRIEVKLKDGEWRDAFAVEGRHVGFSSQDFHWIPADWYFDGEIEYEDDTEDEEEGEFEDEDGDEDVNDTSVCQTIIKMKVEKYEVTSQ